MGGKSVGRYSSVPLPDAFRAKKPNKEEVKGVGREEKEEEGQGGGGVEEEKVARGAEEGVEGGGLDLLSF